MVWSPSAGSSRAKQCKDLRLSEAARLAVILEVPMGEFLQELAQLQGIPRLSEPSKYRRKNYVMSDKQRANTFATKKRAHYRCTACGKKGHTKAASFCPAYSITIKASKLIAGNGR
jgi:hypothetical protein